MAALPASPVPTISPAEMQILISRSGLVLNPGQMADLVLAWRQVAGLIAAIPQGRPLIDDLAYSFRLSPPAGFSPATHARPATEAGGKPVTKSAASATAKPATKASAKTPPRSRPKPKSGPASKARPQAARQRASGGR
jgi:hypothetical protein